MLYYFHSLRTRVVDEQKKSRSQVETKSGGGHERKFSSLDCGTCTGT